MARVVKPKTGRAVLLTQDKTSMFKVVFFSMVFIVVYTVYQYFQCMGKINPFWKTTKQSYANIGGLAALVFFMTRTELIPNIEDVPKTKNKDS